MNNWLFITTTNSSELEVRTSAVAQSTQESSLLLLSKRPSNGSHAVMTTIMTIMAHFKVLILLTEERPDMEDTAQTS